MGQTLTHDNWCLLLGGCQMISHAAWKVDIPQYRLAGPGCMTYTCFTLSSSKHHQRQGSRCQVFGSKANTSLWGGLSEDAQRWRSGVLLLGQVGL